MILPGLIRIDRLVSGEPEIEDIFGSGLSVIFQGELIVQHGDTTSLIIYMSRFGDLKFHCAELNEDEDRRKFAHYLWNSGILMGELVGGKPQTSLRTDKMEMAAKEYWIRRGFDNDKAWWLNPSEEAIWKAEGHSVLELGAGVGLAGIMCALGGANETFLSDYPSPDMIKTLKQNVQDNIPKSILHDIHVEGHLWGDLDSEFAKSRRHSFSRVLAADTLWMDWEHCSLLRSMIHFLQLGPESRVLVIAGFHTGRAKMSKFYDMVKKSRLEIDTIFEMDVDGNRRPWSTSTEETASENKSWLVLSTLKWNLEKN